MGCALFYKICQDLETETEKVFLGVPTTIEYKVVMEIMIREIEK